MPISDKIIVLEEELPESTSIFRFPLPLKLDANPPKDLFRNTVKRLRSYINFLKEDKKSKTEGHTFLTETGTNLKGNLNPNSTQYSVQTAQTSLQSLQLENEELKTKLHEIK